MVHFPIALLMIYSVLEILRFRFLTEKTYWFYIKASFLILGTAMGAVTILSGLAIESLFASQILRFHKFFAISSICLYSLLSLSYLVRIIDQEFYTFVKSNDLWMKLSNLNKNIFRPSLLISLAMVGFALITVTGLIGGIIAFGPGVDPFTEVFDNLFFGGK